MKRPFTLVLGEFTYQHFPSDATLYISYNGRNIKIIRDIAFAGRADATAFCYGYNACAKSLVGSLREGKASM